MSNSYEARYTMYERKNIYEKAEDMLKYGLSQLQDNLAIREKNAEGYHEAFCINSTLHRGFYHPSPIYDLIIGNTKRGRLVSTPPDQKKITQRYLFDCSDCLKCIENYRESQISYVEYLLYSESATMGITIDRNGMLSAISEEIYVNSQIRSFFLVNYFYNGIDYKCFNIHAEDYYYDSVGLSECDFRHISPLSGSQINRHYKFERNNGFLVAYTDISELPTNGKQKTYKITKRRKA